MNWEASVADAENMIFNFRPYRIMREPAGMYEQRALMELEKIYAPKYSTRFVESTSFEWSLAQVDIVVGVLMLVGAGIA
jgi:hypothetical protein